MQRFTRQNRLGIYRVLALFTAIIFITFRYVLPPEAWDPLWLRLIIASIFILGALSTFPFRNWMLNRLTLLGNIMLVIISAWILVLLWQNNLMEEYVLTYFIILFSSIIIFSDFRSLIIFSAANALAGILVAVSVETPLLGMPLFIGSLLLVLLMANIAFGYMIRAFSDARESSRKFQLINATTFEASRDGILLLDEKGEVLEANQQFLELIGFENADSDSYSEELWEAYSQKLQNSSGNSNPDSNKWPILPEGKTQRVYLKAGKILETYTRELNHDKGFSGIMLFFRDISDILSREAELEKSHALISSTLELSGLAILVSDAEENPVLWNDLYLEMWGFSREFLVQADMRQVLEKGFTQIVDDDEVSVNVRDWENSEDEVNYRSIRMKDGRILERTMQRLKLGEADFGRVWFFRDVTDRVMAKEALIQRNFELDSFIYRASHDLRAPVSTVTGFIDLARKEESPDQIKVFLEMINRSVIQLNEFTNRLSSFSRNEREKLAPEWIELSSLIGDLKEQLESRSAKPLEIHLDSDTELFVDVFRLQLIFENLFVNSINYANPEGGKLQIHISVLPSGKDVKLLISDNGKGIPVAYQDKIFNLFFRGNADSTGSGLGLYVARKAARRLGGDLAFNPSFENGAQFILDLSEVSQVRPSQVG